MLHYSANSLVNCNLFNLASVFTSILISFAVPAVTTPHCFILECGIFALFVSDKRVGLFQTTASVEKLIMNSTHCTVEQL